MTKHLSFFSINQTIRRSTCVVQVGNVGIGGEHPIRIQSMTTTNTRDVKATVVQIQQLADIGCEIARITVQGKKEALACREIKNTLVQKGYTIPVVADIHFYPPAAMEVVEYVDKVRINPGNFADKRAQFRLKEYDDEIYAKELMRIEEVFAPLVEKCKKWQKALRIGTNHGSLSDRVMNRFGDTPFGMVQSAIEYAEICRKYAFHNFLFSMKASNPKVMIEAYRLLVAEMDKKGWNYPLHLGVTEAGMGEDGRVKSAMGIGSLLLDGIGDTVRVSLTEDPLQEIYPCKRLISFASTYYGKKCPAFEEKERGRALNREKFSKELNPQGSVVVSLSQEELESPSLLEDLGLQRELGKWVRSALTVDVVIVPKGTKDKLDKYPLHVFEEDETFSWNLFEPKDPYVFEARRYCTTLCDQTPLILKGEYSISGEDLAIQAGMEIGSLLCDQIGEGVWIQAPVPLSERVSLSLALLQAARMRLVKTDFISCPGCGRTLFDLQEVSAQIRERTEHLAGVKIAIMGCIVNGPGEMADADFGYVGSKTGCIDLYVGKKVVERNIPMREGAARLVDLIKKEGRWIEPQI